MKFSRYLQDTQAPEWKKAYIDYRGLKKRITAIRKAQEGLSSDSQSSELDDDKGSKSPPREAQEESKIGESALDPAYSDTFEPSSLELPSGAPPAGNGRLLMGSPNGGRRSSVTIYSKKDTSANIGQDDLDTKIPHPERDKHVVLSSPDQVHRSTTKPATSHDESRHTVSSEFARQGPNSGQPRRLSASRSGYPRSVASLWRGKGGGQSILSDKGGVSRPTNPMELVPLIELIPQLNSPERAFFTFLDAQLDKVESFYTARESEMSERTDLLQAQLNELGDHKKLVQAMHPKVSTTRSTALIINLKDKLNFKRTPENPSQRGEELPYLTERKGREATTNNKKSRWTDTFYKGKERLEMEMGVDKRTEKEKSASPRRTGLSSDPEDYLNAKKKLKKAVLEHYRGLEVLKNYCILNRDGFQKALKKFEKTTKIKAQRQYMSEKVYESSFASDKSVPEMMKRMESLYAIRFTRGDQKHATKRLRAGFHYKSHHYSVFRSGILFGIALPALISGLHASFQPSTRRAIPGWDGLLLIYSILLIPVLFSILIGTNLLVWARSRINYVFIFQLDTRSRLDYREYNEIPSILLASLCYAFWLSFLRIGAPHASPTIWPLVWLGFCGLVMFDPFPLLYKSSRYWLVKNTGKLLASGARRVEFTDFWMGDQFCSLAFSLSNLYLLVCTYVRGFENWSKCTVTSSPHWPVPFVLGTIPFLARLVQSVKRYHDSGLVTHLINGGKYGVGIISMLFFYIWRHQGTTRRGSIFALWLLFNIIYSVCASLWDLLMDWSVLRWRVPYPLLRKELVYTNSIPLYYFAIVTNILIRFSWIIYIPSSGPSINIRIFIAAMLELLRRWQWNFYRLENEHLGNTDQYRITREVPLPYSFDEPRADDATDGDDDDDVMLQMAVDRRHARPRRKTTKKTN